MLLLLLRPPSTAVLATLAHVDLRLRQRRVTTTLRARSVRAGLRRRRATFKLD